MMLIFERGKILTIVLRAGLDEDYLPQRWRRFGASRACEHEANEDQKKANHLKKGVVPERVPDGVEALVGSTRAVSLLGSQLTLPPAAPSAPLKTKPKKRVQGKCSPEAKKPKNKKHQDKESYSLARAPPPEAQRFCLRYPMNYH
jgi:hypothetical protein